MLLRVREAADRLRVSVATVYRIMKAGGLEPVRVGGAVRIRAEEVERIARQGCATSRQAE
jgi:excisionase family DNA binding protein